MTGSRIAELGALLGDPTRAGLLSLMMDGRASTVGELARASHVALSTASEHLTRLSEAGLVVAERQGRYRYYRLAGPQVAGLLETMDTLPLASQNGSVPAAGAVVSRTPHELRFARSCYDHLAGSLAVALHDRLIRDDEGQLQLAPGAAEALGRLGVDPGEAARPAGSRAAPAAQLPGLVRAAAASGRGHRRGASPRDARPPLGDAPQHPACSPADPGRPRGPHLCLRPGPLLGARVRRGQSPQLSALAGRAVGSGGGQVHPPERIVRSG